MQRTAIITSYLAIYSGCEVIMRRHLFLAAMIDEIHGLKKDTAQNANLISAISSIRFLDPAVAVRDLPLLRMAGAFEHFLTRTGERRNIAEFLAQSGLWPTLLTDALKKSAAEDGFWFRLSSASPDKVLSALSPLHDEMLDHNDLLEICPMIACIMNMHSSATAQHSAGVARVAGKLAAQYGLEAEMQKKIEIAGYLHDVGKLLISREIL
ncbi:TPA: HD domain-containing protein, partial [Enterobacter cancerogenus]|nr:HD domain-containing protein [Enterobacter cancerogenus]